MASIINAATSGGLITTADTSGILQLQTAGTTAVTVDASQNVGIGTASPANALHVVKAKVGTGAESFDLLRLNTSGTAAIGDSSNIIWTNGTGSTVVAKISGTLGGDATTYGTLAFSIRNYNTDTVTEAININNRGNTKFNYNIGIGGATPSTSGTGITFPATQSASSDANTLDDYEEGTWTPSGDFSTSNGTRTNVDCRGTYTKVGRMVTVNFYTQVTKGTGSGNYRITGLPFPESTAVIVGLGAYANNMTGVSGGIAGYLGGNTSRIEVYYTGTGSASAVTDAQLQSSNAVFTASVSYFV